MPAKITDPVKPDLKITDIKLNDQEMSIAEQLKSQVTKSKYYKSDLLNSDTAFKYLLESNSDHLPFVLRQSSLSREEMTLFTAVYLISETEGQHMRFGIDQAGVFYSLKYKKKRIELNPDGIVNTIEQIIKESILDYNKARECAASEAPSKDSRQDRGKHPTRNEQSVQTYVDWELANCLQEAYDNAISCYPQQSDISNKAETILNRFKKVIENYKTYRNKGQRTNHFLPFFQYNKNEKISAANSLIQLIDDQDHLMDANQLTILKDGLLYIRLRIFIKRNSKDINYNFKTNDSIKSLDDFVRHLNKLHAKNNLIMKLNKYKDARSENQKMTYHSTIFFKQFTKEEKLDAVKKLIAALEGKQYLKFTDVEKKALKQGSLGKTISLFIKEHGTDLSEHLEIGRLKNVDDLIEHYDSPCMDPAHKAR